MEFSISFSPLAFKAGRKLNFQTRRETQSIKNVENLGFLDQLSKKEESLTSLFQLSKHVKNLAFLHTLSTEHLFSCPFTLELMLKLNTF